MISMKFARGHGPVLPALAGAAQILAPRVDWLDVSRDLLRPTSER